MELNIIKDLTINAIAQSLGSDYLTQEDGTIAVLDNAKLIEVGHSISENENNVEKFTNSLINQLAKINFESREYQIDKPNIFVDSYDWGGFVENVQFRLADVIDDDMWNLVDGKSYEDHIFYQPKIHVKLFNERKSITIPYSIARRQVMTAFKGLDEMNKFISGINVNVKNTINVILESYVHMLLTSAIAISDKALKNSIHLLTEYKEINPDSTLTSETALNDKDFLIFASKRIAETRNNMEKMSKIFNDGNVETFTPKSDNELVILNKFETALKFDVKANTYHDDKIGFGKYTTFTAWQSMVDDNNKLDFKTLSTVAIKGDTDNKLGIGTEDVTIPYVLGISYDKKGIGICPFDESVTSSYTGRADFWTYYNHLLVNYIVNSSYNMVAFIVD